MFDIYKISDSDSGNRGAQQELSVSIKFLKEIAPFQQEFLRVRFQLDLRSRTKKSDSDSIRKRPTFCDSDS